MNNKIFKSLQSVIAVLVITTVFAFYPVQAVPAFQQANLPAEATVLRNSNLRAGPGTNYSIVGGAQKGEVIRVDGCNETCSWYQLDNGEWIAAILVDLSVAPTPTATRTPTRTPTATATTISAISQPITIVTWNVESGDAAPNVIGQRIADFEDIDLWGLSEVNNASDAQLFEAAAQFGENSEFASILSSSGGGDRLLAMYDTNRFDNLNHWEINHINTTGNARAPLVLHLRETASSDEFLFMVNHLYRSRDNERHKQAQLLNQWVAEQKLPVIAVGDYNFDWDVTNGQVSHDAGYDLFVKDGLFQWIQPSNLVTTQCSGWPCRYESVLDFVFTTGTAQNWISTSEIIVQVGDFPDDETTSDHRPVMAQFWVSEQPIVNRSIDVEAKVTLTPALIRPTTNRNANLRSGPGTNYAITGSSQIGQVIDIIGRNQAGNWYQLDNESWIAAFLVDNAPSSLPITQIPPTATSIIPTSTTVPADPIQQGVRHIDTPTDEGAGQEPDNTVLVSLVIIENHSKFEILGIRNDGNVDIDIGGWRLDGSKGDDSCTVPRGVILQPGEVYHVATGDSDTLLPGMKCGHKPIWNNSGETIFLRTGSGVIQIESRKVGG